ncbi:MAG: hypothetical protein ACXW04_07535 [Methylobacter sp.]
MASTKTVTKKQAEIERTAEVTKDLLISFGRLKVPVTHWDKLFWPEEKIAKGDVVNYYISIADYILPYLKNRPEMV